MRLNTYDKKAFVSAAMEDVPNIDYNELCEAEWEKTMKAEMPVIIKDAMKKHPEWFRPLVVSMPYGINNFYSIYQPAQVNSDAWMKKYPELNDQIQGYRTKSDEQAKTRNRLRLKLEAAIGSVSTLKQALELLPEFAKYLPQERDGKVNRSMPVVANLVTDLMAAGWPKDKGQ